MTMAPLIKVRAVTKKLSSRRRKSVARRIKRLEFFLNSKLQSRPLLNKRDVIGYSDRDVILRFLPRFSNELTNENIFNDFGYIRRDTNMEPDNKEVQAEEHHQADSYHLELEPSTSQIESSDQSSSEGYDTSDTDSSVEGNVATTMHQSTPWSTPTHANTDEVLDENQNSDHKKRHHNKKHHFMRSIPHLRLKFSNQVVALVVDSGAQGNLIKMSVLPGSMILNTEEAIILKGIAEDTLQSIGTVTIQFFRFFLKFHVIEVWPEFPHDGIIGAEFLADSESVINFGLKQIEIGGRTLAFKRGKPTYTLTNPINWFGHPVLLLNPLLYLNYRKENNEFMGQFLIDTGAECNVIKKGLASELGKISTKHRAVLQGLSGKLYTSLGTVKIPVFGQNITFQVVPDDFSLPAEGILGGQYFRKNGVTLNFLSKVMRIREKSVLLTPRISLFIRPSELEPGQCGHMREVLSNRTNQMSTSI